VSFPERDVAGVKSGKVYAVCLAMSFPSAESARIERSTASAGGIGAKLARWGDDGNMASTDFAVCKDGIGVWAGWGSAGKLVQPPGKEATHAQALFTLGRRDCFDSYGLLPRHVRLLPRCLQFL
jgi:hypothetical protein